MREIKKPRKIYMQISPKRGGLYATLFRITSQTKIENGNTYIDNYVVGSATNKKEALFVLKRYYNKIDDTLRAFVDKYFSE